MVKRRKPNWWLLYLLVPLMLGLLVADGRIPYPPFVHRIAEFGIVLVSFGLMLLWVHVNEAELIQEEIEMEAWTFEPDRIDNPDADPALVSFDEIYGASSESHGLEVSPTKGIYN